MKKTFRIFLFIICLFMLCSCGVDNLEESDDYEKLSLNEEIGTKGDFETILNTFISSNKDYSIVNVGLDLDNSYGRKYALYDKSGVDDINYPNYDAISLFSIYFERNDNSAKIIDLLYSFPLIYDDGENNLKVTYSLYTSLIKSIVPKTDEDKYNMILDYFKLRTYEDFSKIYNGEEQFNYRIINMGETNENYLSTIYLSDSKTFTLEYHDASFEEKIDH